MTTTRKNNDEALAKFMGLIAEITKMAESVREAADDHLFLTPEEVHWGHVGDATETRNALAHILDRINKTGEYAPDAR